MRASDVQNFVSISSGVSAPQICDIAMIWGDYFLFLGALQ